jgi:hypothetical protein
MNCEIGKCYSVLQIYMMFHCVRTGMVYLEGIYCYVKIQKLVNDTSEAFSTVQIAYILHRFMLLVLSVEQ